ncbi:hypothetical protein ASG89_17050 [Paenibacillus sp. Soil766]|uniref:hypothetical protein n=1 Tax=Paenibacillus sp. Soil766 TaxID=1736404 RepID=UPI00070BE1FA|nr:hypothetical protein [Paenibacillus sp. Soil766]KRF08133.1 hypothetical protein ASG89_17050 [Paenibacillus sp. Soil766]
MITCEQCGETNGSRKLGNSWICGDCKIGDVKTTLKNKAGKVTMVIEKIVGYEGEDEGAHS